MKTPKNKNAGSFSSKAFRGIISGDIISSNSSEAKNLYNKNSIGEIIRDKVCYSFIEALYLLERKKMNVFLNKKKLSFDALMKIAMKKEKNFYARYTVYSDLKNCGYVIKTALKYGADFRVYDKGKKPGEEHSKWIVFPVYETSGLTWHEFAAKSRVAHSTRKNLLIAIVDGECDVTYYEIIWKRP